MKLRMFLLVTLVAFHTVHSSDAGESENHPPKLTWRQWAGQKTTKAINWIKGWFGKGDTSEQQPNPPKTNPDSQTKPQNRQPQNDWQKSEYDPSNLLSLHNSVWWHGYRNYKSPARNMDTTLEMRIRGVEQMCQMTLTQLSKECKARKWRWLLEDDRRAFCMTIQNALSARVRVILEEQEECGGLSKKMDTLYQDIKLRKYFLQPVFVAELAFSLINLEYKFLQDLDIVTHHFKQGGNWNFKPNDRLITFLGVMSNVCFCGSKMVCMVPLGLPHAGVVLNSASVLSTILKDFVSKRVTKSERNLASIVEKLIALDAQISEIVMRTAILQAFLTHALPITRKKFLGILKLKSEERQPILDTQVQMLNIMRALSSSSSQITAKRLEAQNLVKRITSLGRANVQSSLVAGAISRAVSSEYVSGGGMLTLASNTVELIKAIGPKSDINIRSIVSVTRDVIQELHGAANIILDDKIMWDDILANPKTDKPKLVSKIVEERIIVGEKMGATGDDSTRPKTILKKYVEHLQRLLK